MNADAEAMQRHVGKLPPVINILLVLGIGLLLARLVWLFVPAGEDAQWQPRPATGAVSAARSIDINRIVGANLFGQKQVEGQATQPAAQVQETRLNLTLSGVLTTGDPVRARALISSPQDDEKPYAVGDKVPGGASLEEIHPRFVIISRNGRREKLSLTAEEGQVTGAVSDRGGRFRQAAPTPSQATGSAGPSQDVVQELADVREQVLQNPQTASQYVRLQPVYEQGKIKGYRLYPGQEPELFRKLGLQPGEVATSVNGVSLDDPATAFKMLGELANANQVTVTLERGGQSRTVSLSLDQ